MNKYIFSIEGNIGSGKSTLVEYLKQNFPKINRNGIDYNIIYVQEPVDIWNTVVDSTGKNIIERYYSDQKKYAFSFQMMAYITRLSQIRRIIKEAPEHTIILTERCLYTDYNIFAKMLYDSGLIEEIEYSIYRKWFYEFIDTPVSGFIYVKTTPETCLKRILLRNRKGEDISFDYLLNCHNYHERWLLDTNRIILDGEPEHSEMLIYKITTFINNLIF
jgi:deoxyadenosine/deoxycytidine kinase